MGTQEISPTAPDAAAASEPLGAGVASGVEAGSLAIRLLNQLQEQSAQIGQLWQQTQQRLADVELREAALATDRAMVDALRADFERRADELIAQAQRLEDAQRELAARSASEEVRVLGLAQREAGLLEREAGLIERESVLAPREAAITAREQALTAGDRARGELDAQAEALRTEIERLKNQRDALRDEGQWRGAEAGDAESLRRQLEQARGELEGREEALRVLAERLLRAEEQALQRQAELDTLRHDLTAARAAGGDAHAPVASDEGFANALRRARLSRYKQLLNTQSRKIVRAKDALAKRQAECDLVLAQRQGLVERAAELNAREAALAVRSARTGAGVIAACLSAALLLVSALAWTAAGVLAPSRYAATAVLAASTPDREPEDGELDAWARSYRDLLADPTVFQAAAEQFGRRSMSALATPPAVKERVETDFTVAELEPGKLKLEWRGVGAERTSRELETFLAGVVSVAEIRRHARGDGALTVIAQAPTAGQEPLDSQRLPYAAGLTGLGMMVVAGGGLAGFALLRRQDRAIQREAAKPL